ncbi:M18 family aminopeptidase [Brachybacterium nesterenkovii]|uniref:M18 family aminopeptidase n=1 Tax=Brachybacterium nesterenkovii TaxID=47847 RepID=A0A1X6WTP3_9MICO|nr:M18 family aminopeptidase [Brachybacterium nesterenkovii]SLM88511.1 Aspartyl aminopeptidase [Brachybacterium nesterenkovii]
MTSAAPSVPSASSPAVPSAEDLAFARDLGAFVTASPSSFHAAAEAARRLEAAGFTALDDREEWSAADVRGRRFVVRDGAFIAWIAADGADAGTPWRIVGAHTDSPALKLKPNPRLGAEGFAQAGVEIYGGPLLNSWLDRDLRLAGRLVLRDGSVHLAATGPVARVAQLAVHLDRQVNSEGLKLDPQRHLQPILGLGEIDPVALLAEDAGVDAAEVVSWDVVTVDSQEPAVIGARGELFASARLDNLSSTHACLRALLDLADADATGPAGADADAEADADAPISLLVANDHEEVGSDTRSGAGGPFLEDVLVRMHAVLGGDDASRRRAFTRSMVLSCDAGHAVHPNYPERHDPVSRPCLGSGPLLKINAQQRYATDAVGAAEFARACEAADVPFQEFVSNNAMPCGSTIGPITATRLGMTTIDAGIALLSMHSARELCAVADPRRLSLAASAFWRP